jgi:ADP-glucose pyrophosphorylase
VSRVLAVVLAGAKDERLRPLTDQRAKPAVPFGGTFRIIDIPLSNCIHSGLRQMIVLTQYKSQSLNRHLRQAWGSLNPEWGEFLEIVPPQHVTDSGVVVIPKGYSFSNARRGDRGRPGDSDRSSGQMDVETPARVRWVP